MNGCGSRGRRLAGRRSIAHRSNGVARFARYGRTCMLSVASPMRCCPDMSRLTSPISTCCMARFYLKCHRLSLVYPWPPRGRLPEAWPSAPANVSAAAKIIFVRWLLKRHRRRLSRIRRRAKCQIFPPWPWGRRLQVSHGARFPLQSIRMSPPRRKRES